MYILSFTNRFEKDLKLIKKRSAKDLALILDFLKNELAVKGAEGLPQKYRAHKLSGNYNDNWECHVKGDLLIIWLEITVENEIILVRAGSHSDLF
ncbi:type II toxin-antitoxin system YafQ family toxin [Mucilaginibacter mali]|uniref:Type II toxin-antitoxin system YafQ family toxin n=1 Tax=Mucilaginibacter mali TaxID=2740462 RepID=A0A7D4UNG4_9SPHI|nr:type II toxin-antitoxin system YafQ family toxin [Mucilaginibacter mali]QKJ31941.1 type II toxin-antitoxin system YafQ family toxin [Mucilaginibacter mali]